MMDITQVTPDFATSPQLMPDDVAEAKAAGFTTIINDRPDGEEPDQPPSRDIAAAARACGLAYFHIPIVPGQITDEAVAAFAKALAAAHGPVLGFCRTGKRATALFERATGRG